MHVNPRGRITLTEGDPGMVPWDRKAAASGDGWRLGFARRRVKSRAVLGWEHLCSQHRCFVITM